MVSLSASRPASSGNKPTKRQCEVAHFVETFLQQEGRAPSRADIAQHFGFNRASAQQHVAALVRYGVLRHLPGARGIVPVRPANNPRMIPILGRVRAGIPLEAIEDRDGEIEVPGDMFRRPPDLMLRVIGDSMKDVGILDGDLAAIAVEHSAENGQIIVARPTSPRF